MSTTRTKGTLTMQDNRNMRDDTLTERICDTIISAFLLGTGFAAILASMSLVAWLVRGS
jgi:hypothetical protein